MQRVIDEQVDDLIQAGAIEPSRSPHSAPIVLVKKKTGDWRMCIDYRQLNAHSIPDAYPVPRINHILERLRHARFISTLELKQGYWQIPMAADSRECTAFTVPGRGLFQWRVMPFGLHAPASLRHCDRAGDGTPCFRLFGRHCRDRGNQGATCCQFKGGIPPAKGGKPQVEPKEVQFLSEATSVPRARDKRGGNLYRP
ncbi:hypothetical protein ACLKA7_000779 [Drosophila subpalustris]